MFFPACQIKDLSAPLTLINSLTASQRRLTTVAGANSTFTPFTLLMFFPACQIKDLSAPLTLINSLTASQRRLTTVAQFVLLNASQMLHPVFVFFRLSNQRFVRFAHAPVRSLTAPQRRRSIVAAKAHRFRLHPVFIFSRLSNQRFVRFAHAPVRSLTAPQRRLTTVAGANSTFTPFTLLMFFYPSE